MARAVPEQNSFFQSRVQSPGQEKKKKKEKGKQNKINGAFG